MNAYDKRSVEILEQTASALGNGETVRAIIQNAYDLGRTDGALEQAMKTLAKLESARNEQVPA